MRTSGTSIRKLLVAGTVAGLAIVFGWTHDSFGATADFLFGRDAVGAAVASTGSHDASLDTVDLHDGRSPVPKYWREAFEGFARSDQVRLPAQGGVVFVGSSSIAFWSDLNAQFPTRNVVQRGLAGSTMADCTRYADRLILPYRPRVVVVYAGDNDLAAGIAPERIVADYAELVRQVHRELPATKLVFVSIKPSPSRAGLIPSIRRTNALMAAYASADRRLDFVDVFAAMLDHDQRTRRELFRPDGLHLNASGYALWHDAIAQHLD